MKIVGLSVRRTSSKLATAMSMSTGVVSHAENLVVRVEGDDGRVGWGEAAAAPSMTGETLDGMFAAARWLSSAVIGGLTADIASIHQAMDRRMPHNHSVKSAIDIALHDLLGHETGKPVCDLLGRSRRSRVDLLKLVGSGSLGGDVDAARAAVAAGYTSLKLKVGIESVVQDAERTLAVREAVGSTVLLAADANGAWSIDQAGRYLAGVAEAKLDFLEQPVAPEQLRHSAALFREHGVPIGIDESLSGFDDLQRAGDEQLAQGGSFKLIKIGGLAQLVDAIERADRRGFHVNLAGKVAETGIGTAALLHAAAVAPTLAWGCSPSNAYLHDDIVVPALIARDGAMTVPQGPGLGITVDEARLADCTLELAEF
ncbi:dipeptide epimerase [soil metagenome]